MKFIVQGLIKAFWMLVTLDPEVVRITLLTLKVTITATIISVLVGIPLGTFLALRLFRGRNLIVTLVNAGMGMPPVLVGLWVSLFLWRYGPLGFLNAMYSYCHCHRSGHYCFSPGHRLPLLPSSRSILACGCKYLPWELPAGKCWFCF